MGNLNMDSAEHPLEFGKKSQGCETCGGLVPGIRGAFAHGTGICTACDGHGMLWPKLDEPKLDKRGSRASYLRTQNRDRLNSMNSSDEPGSPISPASPGS